jgi:gliding motility-associated-like protein
MFFKPIVKLLPVLIIILMLVTQNDAQGQCLAVHIDLIVDKNADPCKGPITLDANYPGYSHTWNTGANTQKIVVTKSGTYIVVVNDGLGCVGTDTIKVTFLATPMISLGSDPAAQCGGCVTLNTNGGNALEYIWSTGATTENIRFCETGVNKVFVKATNNLGCFMTDTVTVDITPGIPVNLGPNISTCEEEITLTTNLPGHGHVWSTGETTESITVTATDTFYVEVSNNGCTGSDTVIVKFNAKPSVSLGADPSPQCGGCITLDAGSATGTTYTWSNGMSGQKINYCNTGSNTVSVTATNTAGCTDTDEITLNILTGYDVSLGDDKTVCTGSVTLNAPTYPGASYLWSNGQTTKTIDVNSAGTYYVEIFDLSGCNAKDTLRDTIKVIYENSLPASAGINDHSTCREKKFSTEIVNGATSYTWTVPSGSTIISGQGTPSIVVSSQGTVTGNITVVANNHNTTCSSNETALQVSLSDHPLNIPNTFSPNSDGLNDTWVIRNLEAYDNELVVINRWGNEVFRKTNYNSDWNGSALNEGTYFYKMTINFCDEEKVITDYVTIVR